MNLAVILVIVKLDSSRVTVAHVKTLMNVFSMSVGRTQHVKIIQALMNVHVIVDIVLNVKTSTNVRTSLHVQIKTQYATTMMVVSHVLVLLVTAMLMAFVLISTNVSTLTVAMTTQDAPIRMVLISASVSRAMPKTIISQLMALLTLNVKTKMNVC